MVEHEDEQSDAHDSAHEDQEDEQGFSDEQELEDYHRSGWDYMLTEAELRGEKVLGFDVVDNGEGSNH